MYRRKQYPTLNWVRDRCTVDENGCWLWNKSCNPKGYGKLSILGKTHSVHRVVFQLVFREVEHTVMHKCDVRRCCNPKHLDTGSNLDNIYDCIAKGRMVWQQNK